MGPIASVDPHTAKPIDSEGPAEVTGSVGVALEASAEATASEVVASAASAEATGLAEGAASAEAGAAASVAVEDSAAASGVRIARRHGPPEWEYALPMSPSESQGLTRYIGEQRCNAQS